MTIRRPRTFPRIAPASAVLIATELLWAPAYGYERDKSDIVQFRNGNYLTGDIVSMEYGTLALKTRGAKFYGTISTSPDGASLLVMDGEQVERIQMAEVDRLSRYSRTFWNRINGNLAVGFSFTKASDTNVGYGSHWHLGRLCRPGINYLESPATDQRRGPGRPRVARI